ncbi:MAG: hypothetical protein JWR72_2378 [Flavisolibacter sp.]|nr:hypothetical protein [Flavisolibacter sp.]
MLLCLSSSSQKMNEEETKLRSSADFSSFLSAVKNNNTKGCLCKSNEFVVFSFSTKANKTASLCVTKKITTTSGYLIYRFGTKAKNELTFPSDTLNSFSQFSFAHYNRGGGKQNAAMNINSFRFTNGGYTYTLYENWNSEDDRYSKGIIAENNKTSKNTTINAKVKVIGSLYPFTYTNMVTESDEL